MIGDLIGDWLKGILIDGIMGNLSGLFNTVNTKVGEIASDVGTTPQAWNGGIFSMLQSLSETVIVPIAAAILALVMCYELIEMIVEKNNMHDFDSSMFFRWMFKSAFAILIVTNTWNIVMGVFDATQAVVNQSAGVIIGETSIDFDTLLPDLESRLEAMDIGPLLGLWFQTLVVGLTMNILSICIFLVTYGRMIEIYAVTALGPIPLATLGNAEWRGMGQNYLKSLLALGFQAIEFLDISYQLAQADTKTAVFENLCDLYNYLDASIHVQFSFVNRKIDPKQYAKSFEIKAQGDDFDDIRAEYTGILQDQLVKGNNGLQKRKFLTFTIEADNLKMARARLRRIETDLLGYFRTMGAVAWVLDAKERLEVMHSIFHPDGEPLHFDWKWLAPSGLSTKDFIAPSSFRFGNARMFGLGGKYGAVSFLQILSPELSDEMLADFLNTENGIVVNLHVQAIDQGEAIKTVKRKITDLDAMKIQEQKRAVRSGYDMDILPSDLATYGQDAKELLKTLQSRNERMFQLTFLVLNTADTRQKLENEIFWASGVAQKYNNSLVRLDYQQEQGLMSSLPLGASHIKIERSLTTSSVAVFVPFVTQELFQGGNAMYYGINAKTGNMIMLDRKRARCPNGLKLGTPGSGKSMSCKSEILSVFLCTQDDVYICDPEAEYYPLVQRLHGQVVKLSPTSKSYVNPLDINLNYSEDESPLALKSDFVLSFCELVMGGKNGLEAIEKTVIDRAVQVIYRPYLADPRPENMPILSDLHAALVAQHIPEADRVAQALDLYVNGSLNVFNHRTNVNIENRIVAFDIKELGKQLKKLGMLIVQDQIWGRVTQNRSQGKATWYFCDEFHLLLREEQTAAFSCEIWKRFRKWGGVPTGATQNVKDLLSSPEIENILENSDFICLLNQASGDRKILAERLNISPQQLRYVDNSEPGEGLLIYENVILPFKNPIPQNTQLYRIMTTRLGEGATV